MRTGDTWDRETKYQAAFPGKADQENAGRIKDGKGMGGGRGAVWTIFL